MKETLLIILLHSFFLVETHAQNTRQKTTKKNSKKQVEKTPQEGSVYFFPAPIISTSPAFGFTYGVAAATSAFFGNPKTTNISTMQTGIIFTTKNQTLITNKATLYFKNNSVKVDTDWRYLDSNQSTYGLGSGPLSKKLASNGFTAGDEGLFSKGITTSDLLEFKWFRMHQTITKQLRKGLFVGAGYNLDIITKFKDNLLALEAEEPVITSFYAYNEKYGFKQNKSTLSGISLNGIYDTRDNINAPYKGRFAKISFVINPKFLGSNHNSTSLWTEYRDYFNLTKNHKNMLAVWVYGNFQTSGKLPYMNLPAINYDQYSTSGRGYAQGRIRGQSLFYSELEYRAKLIGLKKIPDFFGVNLFFNVTSASNKDANIDLFEYLDPAGGVGLRFQIDKDSRTAISIDYAVGKYGSAGIYLAINEFF